MFKQIAKVGALILSPPFCEGCRRAIADRFIFCIDCFDKIKMVTTREIPITKNMSAKLFAIADYTEPLRSLILAKKYSNQLASKQLAKLIWQMTALRYSEFDYLVPVPLHWARQLKRGYNQAEIIADELAKFSGAKKLNLLKRKKYTWYQSSLDASQREKNLKNSFTLTGKIEKGSKILLVDDLFTSGATIKFAAKELLKTLPAQIDVAVACRVV